ncbi:hypothetical protein CRG98_030165 [Punica granatum]|uniref:G-patch domain-containing protein n=1 Tax=Punica granatum TaxID=22663 RepID=A0A2I0J092_PUNGR|nr:hypothetical protein CRG98_030165 [Punica granatum]
MSHPVSCPRLDRVTPPLEEITRIWRALRPVDRRYISAFVGDIPLLVTRHVDWNFLEAAIAFWNPSRAVFDIQEPNFHTARPTLVSRLLGVPTTRLNAELAYSGSTEIAIEKLLFFIESRAHRVQGDFLRKDLCHAVLLLIFGTILFPRSHSLINAALASVVLQVVVGRGYEVALVAETIRSLDRVLRICDRRIRGSPMLLQIWLQSHANPLRLVRSIMYFNGPESIISRLLPLLRVEERKTVPEDTVRTRFEHTWREDQTPVDRQSNVEQVLDEWQTVITERPYFPEHLTLDERDFQATKEYILRFYRWGGQPSSAADDRAVLESTVNQLAATMATNMVELMALLKGPNRASSSFTPPPGYRPAVDPNPWAQPTLIPDNGDTSAPTILPPKVKVLDFQKYDGTTNPRHHLRHYRGKMLQYWDFEQFVIATSQESLSGPALNWLTWASSLGGSRVQQRNRKESPRGRLPQQPPPLAAEGVRRHRSMPSMRATTRPTVLGELHACTVYYPRVCSTAFAVSVSASRSVGLLFGPADSISIDPATSRPSLHSHSSSDPAANLFPDHELSSGPTINMINVGTIGEYEANQEGPSPFVIEYVPPKTTVGFTGFGVAPTPFVIEIPTRELYQDSKVPWTYEGSVANLEQQFSVMGVTRSGRVHENPEAARKGKAPAVPGVAPEASSIPQKKMTEEEAEAFMKIIKASKYKVVEQMGKSTAHISLLALLLGSEPHCEALLKVLTVAQVPKETAPDLIAETVGLIFSNNISFSDDELPSEGYAHSRALHIVCKCNNFVVGRVMIDNGSALNVLDTPNAFSLLLGRPWIHSAGAVPSTLHQKLKFIVEERLITNLPFHSFDTISVIRDYGKVGPSCADRMVGKILLRHNYIPGSRLGAHGQGINRPIEIEEYKNMRGLGFRPSCHEIIEARRGKHLHRLAARNGKINKGIPVHPLSYFFPGPPHIVGGTLDGPSSNSDSEPVDLPTICAVTEETTPRAYIRLAQENEELNNWTSIPHYSAVIADV